MEINQQELANLVQTLITDALVKGGIIPAQEAPVVVEEEPATPLFLVTINGTIVDAPVADEDELAELIEAVLETNEDAEIRVYELNEDLGEN